ncbi:MAG: bifunctional metallophosphatase/5'-nucleotidase [Clostridiales bacterium]|nr:bifunctional metallophosphatase/5'-nucleotidase [Clostridiales bacterium]
MKKVKITLVALLVALAVMCLVFSGCDLFGHQHSYPNTYAKDSDSHWKVCKICSKATTKSAHVFDEWIVDEEPTETKAGSRHAICTVCEYEKIESIDPTGGECQHSFSNEYKKLNATLHYQECTECGYKEYSNHVMGGWIEDVQATTSNAGHKYRDCNVKCGYREEQTIPPISDKTQATGTVDFYAINDFHGEYEKLAQVSGFISDKLDNGNTVALNSGDMFQGSMESNWNYGNLFANCMDIAGFDAFTYGNHEFDWGLDNLRSLANNSNVPFLGANIYNWNPTTKTWGSFADDIAQKYVIKEFDNGLKVGIIGVIGSSQITSISSQLVQTIGFKDPLPIIKELATELRDEKGCNIVVASVHAGPQDIVGEDENKQQPSSSAGLSDYVDAVFCAHTHVAQNYLVDGIPFIQGGSNGNYVSHVRLTVESNGNVRCDGASNLSYYSLNGINSTVKSQVQTKIDNSNAQIASSAQEVLTNFSGGLNSSVGVPRLVCHAMATYAVAQGYDISLAMTNVGRSSISSGNVTYSALYEAIPFDNVVYVAEVSGADIYKLAVTWSGYSIWRVKESAIENSSSKYYKIAVIDYLLFHQNVNRNYNYFSSAFSRSFTPVALTKVGESMYNYRLITRDFLKEQRTVNTNLYSTTNDFTDNSKLTQEVDLSGGATTPTEPTHAGTLADPYSVADAILLASGYSSRTGAPSGFVKGTVCDVSKAELSSSSGDIFNVYVTDGNGNKFLLYYIKKFQGATSSNNWSSAGELSVGDELIFYAQAMYTYNSTPEAYNGYVVSINGVATAQ